MLHQQDANLGSQPSTVSRQVIQMPCTKEAKPGKKNYIQPRGMLASLKRFIGHLLIWPPIMDMALILLPSAQESLKAWCVYFGHLLRLSRFGTEAWLTSQQLHDKINKIAVLISWSSSCLWGLASLKAWS